MVTLNSLSKVLPGLRGAAILDDAFSAQEEVGENTPHAVYLFPPHVLLLLDEGRCLLGFDAVGIERQTPAKVLFEQMGDQTRQEKSGNALSDPTLKHGLLAFRTNDKIINIFPGDVSQGLYYIIHRSRFVRAVRFDIELEKWHFTSKQDVLLGEAFDDFNIQSIQFCLSRSTFVWIAVSDTTKCLMIQQQSTMTGVASPTVLMENIPECDLYLFGDIICLIPRSDNKRELYFWPIGTQELSIYYYGLGFLKPLPGKKRVKTHEFRALQRSIILPARLKISRTSIRPTICAVASDQLTDELLILDSAGRVCAVKGKSNAVAISKLCQLHSSRPFLPRLQTAMLIHQDRLFVSDEVGCHSFLLPDGVKEDGLVSSIPHPRFWQSFGLVIQSGIWTPTDGAWQLRGKPILDQAASIAAGNLDSMMLAAEMCSRWQMPRVAGKYALDALRCATASLDQGQGTKKNAFNAPNKDQHTLLSDIAKMLAHVRQVERSPIIPISVLGTHERLHELTVDEIQMYCAGAGSHISDFKFEDRGQAALGFDEMCDSLIGHYKSLSDRYIALFTDSDESLPIDREEQVRARISQLLLQSKSVASGDDSMKLAYEFGAFVEDAPADVAFCVFESLGLSDALSGAYPSIPSLNESSKSLFKFMIFDNPRLSWTTQLFEQSSHRICLFEVLTKILVQVRPETLVEFVRFCAAIYYDATPKAKQEKQLFIRAADCLHNTFTKKLSRKSARAEAMVFRLAGYHIRALRKLVDQTLWEDALGEVDRAGEDKALHRQLFSILVEELHKNGKLNYYAGKIFVQNFAPDTFRLEDLFGLFQGSTHSVECAPLVSSTGSGTKLENLRDYLEILLERESKTIEARILPGSPRD